VAPAVTARFLLVNRNFQTGVKVSLMLVALLWMLIFRLSESGPRMPDFVYVNF
jgi:hypothetical protein